MKTETRYILLGAVILAAIGVILYFLPGDAASTDVALNKLKVATGFTLLALVFLYAFAVLVYIAKGDIDLSGLLDEAGSKGASMSRFQLLIFTIVIALSLFLVVIKEMKFPASIPPEVLTLLGISASTYAVSKGIQVSGGQTTTTTQSPDATVTTSTPASGDAATTITSTKPTETTTTTLPPQGGASA